MKKFNFIVNSLQHHDYKDRLQELFDTAMGKSMTITIQPDNKYEKNSIPVYYRNDFVGYVTTGEERRIAYQAIKQSTNSSLKGEITEIYPEDKILNLYIETEEDIDIDIDDEVSEFEGWEYKGKVLPVNENVYRLRSMIEMLCEAVKRDEAWDEENEYNLVYIEENMWRDICFETQKKIGRLIQDMKIKESAEWKLAGRRLSKANARLSKDKSTELRVNEIYELATSVDMNIIMNYYGINANRQVSEIPKWFESMFEEDELGAMRKLRYARLKEKQYQAMKTLLAMKVRLRGSVGEKNELEEKVLEYVMRLKSKWRGKGDDGSGMWSELIRSNLKVEYKGKTIGLFEKKNRKTEFDKASCQKLVGIMADENLYDAPAPELAGMLEPSEKPHGACVHNINRGNYQDCIFHQVEENVTKTLRKWKL